MTAGHLAEAIDPGRGLRLAEVVHGPVALDPGLCGVGGAWSPSATPRLSGETLDKHIRRSNGETASPTPDVAAPRVFGRGALHRTRLLALWDVGVGFEVTH